MEIAFEVAEEKCSACGQCIADCPAHILEMVQGYPRLAPDREASCYRCQHCFAVCPTGAVSILGVRPEHSENLAGGRPDPLELETLVRGRRSVRRYLDENLEPALMQRLLEAAWQAPTGRNARQVLLTVVDDRAKLARLRAEVVGGISRLVREGALPEEMSRFGEFARLWEEEGVDILFRGAPHLLLASAPAEVATPMPDCLIAMTTFDLLAQAHGVGTLWDGLATWAIQKLVPESRTTLGIPADHVIGYVLLFGKPAVRYARTVQHRPALIQRMA
jgi:nitroreductase/NAD-dependent dihydropyrimidine dehydrogenase PreA subunit